MGGGTYLVWVRVLRKKKKKGLGILREKIGGSIGIVGHWVLGLKLLECWSWD